MDKKLALLQSVTVLSSPATEATVLFDDATGKMEETAGLRDQLRISEEELKGCEGTLRKIMDRCFDLRGALRQEVLAALSQLPTEEGPQNLASHWKMFHTRTSLGIFQHVGCCTPAWPTRPSEFESCLLPGGLSDVS